MKGEVVSDTLFLLDKKTGLDPELPITLKREIIRGELQWAMQIFLGKERRDFLGWMDLGYVEVDVQKGFTFIKESKDRGSNCRVIATNHAIYVPLSSQQVEWIREGTILKSRRHGEEGRIYEQRIVNCTCPENEPLTLCYSIPIDNAANEQRIADEIEMEKAEKVYEELRRKAKEEKSKDSSNSSETDDFSSTDQEEQLPPDEEWNPDVDSVWLALSDCAREVGQSVCDCFRRIHYVRSKQSD